MRRVLVLVVVAVLAAVGCAGSSSSDGSATTAAGDAGAVGTDPTAGGCPQFTAGEGGVVQTFCDGPGTVTVKVGDASGEITGVTCAVAGGYYTLQGGVQVDQGPDATFKGALPDFVQMLLPEAGGSFTDVTMAFHLDGKTYAVTKSAGTVDVKANTGTFTGTALAGEAVSGSFKC